MQYLLLLFYYYLLLLHIIYFKLLLSKKKKKKKSSSSSSSINKTKHDHSTTRSHWGQAHNPHNTWHGAFSTMAMFPEQSWPALARKARFLTILCTCLIIWSGVHSSSDIPHSPGSIPKVIFNIWHAPCRSCHTELPGILKQWRQSCISLYIPTMNFASSILHRVREFIKEN